MVRCTIFRLNSEKWYIIHNDSKVSNLVWAKEIVIHARYQQRLWEKQDERCERYWAIICNRCRHHPNIFNFSHIRMKARNRHRLCCFRYDECVSSKSTSVRVAVKLAPHFRRLGSVRRNHAAQRYESRISTSHVGAHSCVSRHVRGVGFFPLTLCLLITC